MTKNVLLVNMPFGALERQALGLSLLKARLAEEGFSCDIRYLTFTFARLIGADNYYWITTDLPHTAFAGEWTFVPSLYGSNGDTQSGYVRHVLEGIWHLDKRSVDRLLHIQKMAEHFIQYCFSTIDWKHFSLVGFTSTFEQNISSLALAQRIKAAYPWIPIAFGGANWEGDMGIELHRRFTFVDYAFLGEAEESFPSLIRSLFSRSSNHGTQRAPAGVVYRKKGKSVLTCPPRPVRDLDKLPIPDYSDYFSELDLCAASSVVVPTLLFESARGCWWGNKHQCLFCGLNGSLLTFRAKSASRVLQELDTLVSRWKIDMLQAVDNVASMTFFKDLFPSLAHRDPRFDFFYEIRANLNRHQVKMLMDAGVTHVQPGIESINDHILTLMHKGTTALQNIQLLKWCKEYGISADWNMLYGFPGETDDDYRHILKTLPHIRFLGAPTACGPIRLDRFSPYFKDHQSYGIINVRPLLPYKFLYPFNNASVAHIANYFDYDIAAGTSISKLSTEMVQYIEEWQRNPERGTLECIEQADGKMLIVDTRSDAIRQNAILNPIDKETYSYCDQVRSIDDICTHLRVTYPRVRIEKDQVVAFLSALTGCGYMISDGMCYLSLALRRHYPARGEELDLAPGVRTR